MLRAWQACGAIMAFDTDYFREKLLALREEAESRESADKEQNRPVELDQQRQGRLSRMDALQGQAMSQALSRRRALALKRIEAALARLEEGEFGFCVSCGEAIDVKRLEIDPSVAQCTDCAAGG